MARYLPSRPAARRGLAFSLGLLPWLVLELALRCTVGPPPFPADPFVEFADQRPLFVLNEVGDKFHIPPNRQPFFKPDSFAARKAPNGIRIFCLGGSTVQGNPYSIETAFPNWLELSLQVADPGRDWEVVNCGGISYASYRLVPIARECLRHQADLLVLYVGDNEFLEDRTYASVRELPSWVQAVAVQLGRLQLFQWARHGWEAARASRRTKLPGEVAARLDVRGGLEQYHRDDAWRRGVGEHYRLALLHIVADARRAGVPVLLVDPVANVRDCPPFKSELEPRQTPEQQREFTGHLQAARAEGATDEQRVVELEAALHIDPRHAQALYLLGQAYLAQGRAEEARSLLLRAKDEDVCPLRLTEPLREILREVAAETGAPLVPAWSTFQRLSPHGLPGDELLLDHVHPTISGQQLIAQLLFDELRQRWSLSITADFETRRAVRYRDQISQLDAPYFARGKEHLEGLRRWAAGRAGR